MKTQHIKILETLCLLTLCLRKQGPQAVAIHLNKPKASWIFKRIPPLARNVISFLQTMLVGTDFKYVVFRDAIVKSSFSDMSLWSVEKKVIYDLIIRFMLGQSQGLSPLFCCYLGVGALPAKNRVESLNVCQEINRNIKLVWYQESNVEKFKPDSELIFEQRRLLSMKKINSESFYALLLLNEDKIKKVYHSVSWLCIRGVLDSLDLSKKLDLALREHLLRYLDAQNFADYWIDRKIFNQSHKTSRVVANDLWLNEGPRVLKKLSN